MERVSFFSTHRTLLGLLAATALTLLVFHKSVENGFVNWDDPFFVTENPSVQKLDARHLKEIFATTEAGAYTPLSRLSIAVDYALWGERAEGFHFTALVLHALNTGLVFLVSRILLARITSLPAPHSPDLGALVAALAFGLHPMRVESVAWIAERRDVLSLFFVLLTVLAYFRYLASVESARPVIGWYFSALSLYIMAVLAKAMVVTLPLVLLLLDVWPFRRIPLKISWQAGRRAVRCLVEKAPLLLVSLGVGLGTIQVLQSGHKLLSTREAGWESRVAQSSVATASYISKTLVPTRLNPLDPLDRSYDFSQPEVRKSAALVLGITLALAAIAWRRHPGPLMAWISSLVLIAPFLGLAIGGLQLTADRYTYLASIPLCIAFGELFQQAWATRLFRPISAGIALLIFALLGFLTVRQVNVWRDSVTLWTHSLTINPNNSIAWNNLGVARAHREEYSLAIPCYENVLKRMPEDVAAWLNLANACNLKGDDARAVTAYLKALQLDKFNRPAHHNLAGVLLRKKEFPQALLHYQAAMKLQATPETESQIGRCMELQGNLPEAISHYRAAAKDGHAEAWIRWAELLRNQKHAEEALTVLKDALATSNDPRIQIAFAETALTTRNPRALEDATRLMTALDSRLNGQSQKVHDLLAQLQKQSSKKL